MRILYFLIFLVSSIFSWGQGIPTKYCGDWLLVNSDTILHIESNGIMSYIDSDQQGPITIMENGDFGWALSSKTIYGYFSDEKLFLKNQAGVPKALEYIEYRKVSKDVAVELTEFSRLQKNQFRRNINEKMIMNNLRQLAIAVDQFFLDNGVNEAKWEQIVGPGKSIKELRSIDGEDYSKLVLRKDIAEWTVTSRGGITVTCERKK